MKATSEDAKRPTVEPRVSRGRPVRSSISRAGIRHLLVLAAMFALSIIQTWPLFPLRKTHILGANNDDCWINPWHEDWLRDSVVNWHSPFFAPQLHYPVGAELYWHSLAVTKNIWGLLLPYMGIIELTNLVTFWTFPLAGLTAWWLIRDVLRRNGHSGTIPDLAAFVGACVFTFSRYHFAHSHAHANLNGIEGIPFFVFAVFRYFETQKKGWLAAIAFAAAYVVGCDFYYLYYVAIFFATWLIATVWSDGPLFSRAALRHPILEPALPVAIASGLGALPVILPLLLHLKPAPWSIHGDSTYPADPLMLFVPDVMSRWTVLMPEPMAHAFWKLQKGILNDNEGGLFLGFATPILAVIAYRAARPQLRPWVIVGAVFFVLSFGCFLNIGGTDQLPPPVLLIFIAIALGLLRARRDLAIAATVLSVLAVAGAAMSHEELTIRIPMPYLFFKEIAPLYSRGGMSVRFLLMTQLALAVLVPFGVLEVMRRLEPRGRHWQLGALALALLAVNIETANKPFAMTEVKDLPPVFDQIRDDPEPVAVFTDHVLSQWEILHHRRPISFARQSRTPMRERAFVLSPLNQALVEFQFGEPTDADVAAMKQTLKDDHFKYFVGHHRHAKESIRWKKLPADIDEKRTRFLTDTLGGRIIHDDDDYQVVEFW